jgi:hypothetical protein
MAAFERALQIMQPIFGTGSKPMTLNAVRPKLRDLIDLIVRDIQSGALPPGM